MRVRGRDIHHGWDFYKAEAGQGTGYQMRVSDTWWLISLITTHSATSYSQSVYYQEWWVQFRGPPQWALSAIWYNSPDLTQTWRMSVWFSQQPHSYQSGLMINRGRFSIGSDKIQPELNMVITGSWGRDNLVKERERERERERGCLLGPG